MTLPPCAQQANGPFQSHAIELSTDCSHINTNAQSSLDVPRKLTACKPCNKFKRRDPAGHYQCISNSCKVSIVACSSTMWLSASRRAHSASMADCLLQVNVPASGFFLSAAAIIRQIASWSMSMYPWYTRLLRIFDHNMPTESATFWLTAHEIAWRRPECDRMGLPYNSGCCFP